MLGFRMLLAVRQRRIFKCFIHVSLDCSFAKGLQILHQLLTLLIPPWVLLLFRLPSIANTVTDMKVVFSKINAIHDI